MLLTRLLGRGVRTVAVTGPLTDAIVQGVDSWGRPPRRDGNRRRLVLLAVATPPGTPPAQRSARWPSGPARTSVSSPPCCSRSWRPSSPAASSCAAPTSPDPGRPRPAAYADPCPVIGPAAARNRHVTRPVGVLRGGSRVPGLRSQSSGPARGARPHGRPLCPRAPSSVVRHRRRPHVRARHLGAAVRSARALPLRRARGRDPGRRGRRARGQALAPRARLLRAPGAAAPRRPARRARPPRRPDAGGRARRHAARRAQPHRHLGAAERASSSATTTPASSPWRATSPPTAATSCSSARTCRCASRRRRSASPRRSTAPSSPSRAAGPAWPRSTCPAPIVDRSTRRSASTSTRRATSRATRVSCSSPSAAAPSAA